MSTKRSRYLKKSYREELDKANAKVARKDLEEAVIAARFETSDEIGGCPACGSTEVSFRVSNHAGETYQCRCRHCGIDYFTSYPGLGGR